MRPLHCSAAVISMLCFHTIADPLSPIKKTGKNNPKIQAAILLDVSNSMDGLIDQAKNQLWNMVNVLSKVTCRGIFRLPWPVKKRKEKE